MKIIAFTGMPFSGKSEAVEIAKRNDIPVIRIGDMIWDEVKSRNLELSDENVGKIANDMRKKHGKDIWARRTIEKIKKMKTEDILVVDGVRNDEEVETFKQNLAKDFILVAVEVPDKLRYQRAMNRNRQDDALDLEKVKLRDKREIGWGIDRVIASADIVISNKGSLEEFQRKINNLFKR
ncbi:MAG: flagellar hook-basal body complex protein FliE [Thermoplasmatales archaeon]|nr:MAG: flagellar hook-basal body complex protein FliE [Thermoplasmatales archaeon]